MKSSLGNKEVMASNIRRHIDKLGLNVKDFSREIGVSYSTVRDWANAVTYPRIDKIEMMANYFGVNKSDLVEIKTEASTLDKITSAASKLEEERQEKVLGYCEDQLSEQERGGRELPTVDERFTNVTDIYRRLSPERQEEARRSMNRQLRSQNIVKMEEIQKAQDLYESLGEEFEDIGLYGEVSAGTGVWVSDEPVETIKYPVPVPWHDIALRVNGNSMEPMFHDGDVVFVKKTPEVHHGSIIIIIVNDSAYIKKLYRRDDEVRLISLNPQYEDIVLNPDDTIEIIGNVIM